MSKYLALSVDPKIQARVRAELVYDISQTYHYLKKDLRKTLTPTQFKEQELILNEQWWEDVCIYFGWEDTTEYWEKKLEKNS